MNVYIKAVIALVVAVLAALTDEPSPARPTSVTSTPRPGSSALGTVLASVR